VTAPPSQDPNYLLKPALRLVDELQVGKITTNVDLAALTSAQLGSAANVSNCKRGCISSREHLRCRMTRTGTLRMALIHRVSAHCVRWNQHQCVDDHTVHRSRHHTVAATCNFDVDTPDGTTTSPCGCRPAGISDHEWTTVGNVSVTATTHDYRVALKSLYGREVFRSPTALAWTTVAACATPWSASFLATCIAVAGRQTGSTPGGANAAARAAAAQN